MALNRQTALREQIRKNTVTKNKKIGIKPTVVTPIQDPPLKPSEIVKKQKKNRS